MQQKNIMPTIQPQSFSRPKYRPDVDGMRALAILSVLFFHAYSSSFPGGFVGVDIFFVISGYLISSIIFRGLTLGSFSFFDFYARRVRRIFPAVTIVLIGSFILGFYLLTPGEFKDLIRESPYAAFFLENWHLYATTGGYWETATELKPLMHFWSLGVEEQYYIFYPLICYLLWKVSAKRFLASLMVMLLVSLVLCLYDTYNDSVRAFYSLHARFWELLIGGVLAYVELQWPRYKKTMGGVILQEADLNNILSVVGFSLIVFSLIFFEAGKYFPGWRALLPTIGALLIIAAGTEAFLNKHVFSNKLVVFIGLISYPLYLWHWPLFCIFKNNLAGESPTGSLMLVLIFVSFLLAYLTYTLIERPMRSKKATWKLVLALVLLLLLVSVGSKQLLRKNEWVNEFIESGIPKEIAQLNVKPSRPFQRDKQCLDKFGGRFNYCHTSGDKPSVLIFGDSHNHVMLGYLENQKQLPEFYLVANDGLIVFDNVIASDRKNGKEDALVINKFWNVVEHSPEIRTVILRGNWSHHLTEPLISEINESWNSTEIYRNHWNHLINRLVSKGKKVVVVLDNPELDASVVKKCLPLQRISFLTTPCEKTVGIKDINSEYQKARDLLLRELSKYDRGVLKVIDLGKVFCPENKCFVMFKDKPLFMDDDHLSVYGNEFIWPLIEKEIVNPGPF